MSKTYYSAFIETNLTKEDRLSEREQTGLKRTDLTKECRLKQRGQIKRREQIGAKWTD